jgi:hypothetical protein
MITPGENWSSSISNATISGIQTICVQLKCHWRCDGPPSHQRLLLLMDNLNCANAGITAAVHIRYLSALSLYLLLVCANANPSVVLFLPLSGISSPRNPEQDTRTCIRLQYPLFNILTIQHDGYTQQPRPANRSDSSYSFILPPRNTSPEDCFV